MPTEYAGKVQGDTEYAGKRQVAAPLRFDELTGGLIESINKTADRRQGRRDSDEKIFQDAKLAADEIDTQKFETQSLQTLMHNGVNGMRDGYYDLNQQLKTGKITRSEYTARINATQTGLSMFANVAKTYDDTVKNFISRQQAGPDGAPKAGSEFEQYMAGVFADMGDLSNKKLVTDMKTGELYLAKYDAEGNEVGRVRATQISNPGNMIDNNYDLFKSVNREVSKWGSYKKEEGTGRGGFTTYESVKRNPDFGSGLDALQQSVVNTPRYAASVLSNNGADYGFYRANSGELEEAITERLEREERLKATRGEKPLTEDEIAEFTEDQKKKMILVTYDGTNTMQPELTPDQYTKVKEIIENQVGIQLGYSVTKTAGWKPDKPDKPEKPKPKTFNLYKNMSEAYEKAMKGDLDDLNDLSQGKLIFKKNPDGTITAYDSKGLGIFGGMGVKKGSDINSVNDLGQFFYTGSKGIQEMQKDRFDYENSVDYYWKKYGNN